MYVFSQASHKFTPKGLEQAIFFGDWGLITSVECYRGGNGEV